MTRPCRHRVANGCAVLLAGVALQAGAQAPAAEPRPLTVCMAADNAPLSHLVAGQPRGLDVRIAQAAAQALGRPLKVLAFESEYEKESTLGQEVNALLSAGLCDAASGFPLLADDLGPPQRANARTPDYPGAKRKRERPFVPLGTLVAGRAYQAVTLGLVQRPPPPGSAPLSGLAELAQHREMKLGAVTGTLGGTLAIGWRMGALRAQTVSLGQRDDPLALLARSGTAGRPGDAPRTGAPAASAAGAASTSEGGTPIDALLLPLALFDGWALAHPGAALVASPWRKPIGVNLGFVTLQGAVEVRTAIDTVLTRALADGRVARWAAEEGVSWTAPQSPEVSRGFGMAALLAD